jgi:hypothetical protein
MDKTLSYGASTTGTIYGIYDMSGGAWEYVMAIYKPDTSNEIRDCSGYSTSYAPPITCPSEPPIYSYFENLNIDPKYYNRYLSQQGKIGDATIETKDWNDDISTYLPHSLFPWQTRGGYYGDGNYAGVWGFSCYTGGIKNVSDGTFRIVLVAQD